MKNLLTGTLITQAPQPLPLGEKFGFGDINSLGEGTQRLVNPLFQIAAFLVVIYFTIAAFKYMKAGANKEDIESAKQMIIHGFVGFMLLILAFLILQFIPQFFNLSGLDIIK